jgi:hypothetical protein
MGMILRKMIFKRTSRRIMTMTTLITKWADLDITQIQQRTQDRINTERHLYQKVWEVLQ